MRIIIIAVLFILCVSVNAFASFKEGKEKSQVLKDTGKMSIELAVLVGLVVFLFQCVLMLNWVPSGSMEDTLMSGDMILSARFNTDKIERYDICVFYAPDEPDTLYVKRVIGLPGETITVENGSVYADGEKLQDDFIKEEMDPYGDGVFHVPEDSYFMLGDNRNDSNDSRFWDNPYVSSDMIQGKVFMVLLPFHDAKIF